MAHRPCLQTPPPLDVRGVSLGITGVCMITKAFTGHPFWDKLCVRSLDPGFPWTDVTIHHGHSPEAHPGPDPGLSSSYLRSLALSQTQKPLNQYFRNECMCFYKINTLYPSYAASEA